LKKGEKDDWKLEHKLICEQRDAAWPETTSSPDVNLAGMLPREREVAAFVHNVFESKGDQPHPHVVIP
jgi:hypothetical protein